ncbi:SCO family protein [Tamlana agarivorans]|uniref:SCO family protein n=1 Tax=Pseudotamlana agarivorans TaxID=481183 RepID=A0ACC5U6X7_9FLAO|nr:SCO family protein [Tamlana agarivorans]MBU2950077.1 SCO family protein [Tamlana agarivorans]
MNFKLNYISVFVLVFFLSCKKEKKEQSVSSLPYFNSADFTPEWEVPKHKIPAFSFTNQNGMEVTNTTYAGKMYIADFFFTSCSGICPKLTKNMAVIQEIYKNDKDIMLLSHTVMPWRDSVPLLKEYAIKNKVLDHKWNLVTGNKEALYHIARTGYFADEDFTKTQDESNFIHTENFVLVDKNGYIRGVYNGTIPVDIERLKRHIAILKKEA